MPERPGLVRVNKAGLAIALEVWQMPVENFGRFVAGIPSPLAIGTLTLADGSQVQGFLCEAYATYSALDISALGGWRGYLNSR
jgi:allophanate hydrolase